MMDYFAVEGGRPLEGRVFVHGAKNSALPLLAATLLADGESVLHNCPDLTDISAALGILSGLGCRVRREGATVMVDPTCRRGHTIPDELMGQMRASVLFLGSLLARDGEAVACWPGGCALGARPMTCTSGPFRPWAPRCEAGMDVCPFMAPGSTAAGWPCPSPAWEPRKTPCWRPAAPRGSR